MSSCISGQFCIDFYLSNTYFRKFLKENILDMLFKGRHLLQIRRRKGSSPCKPGHADYWVIGVKLFRRRNVYGHVIMERAWVCKQTLQLLTLGHTHPILTPKCHPWHFGLPRASHIIYSIPYIFFKFIYVVLPQSQACLTWMLAKVAWLIKASILTFLWATPSYNQNRYHCITAHV